MYCNSRAAYDDPVPMWLLRFVRLTHNHIVMDEEQEAIDHKEQLACEALIADEAAVELAESMLTENSINRSTNGTGRSR